MTNNPLIAKWEELYGKKEEPKLPRIEEVEETYKLPPEWNIKGITTPSVATSNTGITSVNPLRTFTSYEPTEDAFLDVASKVQRGDAKVVSMHMNISHFRKSYTIEVQVFT